MELEHYFLLFGLGAFGGLLFGVREFGLRLPRYDRARGAYMLGFVGDTLFGLAGALVIFVLIPADLNGWDEPAKVMRLAALALIGGYGGPALLDKVLNQTFHDLKNETDAMRADLTQQSELLKKEVLDRRQKDFEALSTVDQYLNDTEVEGIDARTVAEAVRMASEEARLSIYELARSVRRQSWRSDPIATERTIPVFEALLEVGIDNEEHRICANLAYALKDKTPPDYRAAADFLNRAIELRKEAGLSPSAWYHFNRAMSLVGLAQENPARVNLDSRTVLKDIAIARTNPLMAKAVQETKELQEWLNEHGDIPVAQEG